MEIMALKCKFIFSETPKKEIKKKMCEMNVSVKCCFIEMITKDQNWHRDENVWWE